MNFEFLFRRAHSRRRVERRYWSGASLNSFTACSKEVTTGMIGPIGSGLPQFGFPRRFAMIAFLPSLRLLAATDWIRPFCLRIQESRKSLPVLWDEPTLVKRDRLPLFAQKTMHKLSHYSVEN